MELLTTAEAADYLRLKERKLYELVAEGAVPCTKVTGKWLFPRAELDRWLDAGMARPAGLAPVEPPPIVGGSQDPLLDWALRESGSGLAGLPEGSEAGIARLRAGSVVAAAIHLHDLEDGERDANVAAALGGPGLSDAVLIAFARREQCLIVAPGNPLGLSGLADMVRAKARLAMRPAGAGARLLLMALLRRDGHSIDDLAKDNPLAPTGPDVATAIRTGRADCGIASRSVAQAAGLDAVPLCWERFDLLMRQRDYFRPPMQKLLSCMTGTPFRTRAADLTGYDVSEAGMVRAAA